MMWWNNGMGWGGMGWGGWVVMIVVMVAIWALVAFAGIAIFRGIRNGRRGTPTGRDASQILDERFARGEIDVDEYHARQDALRAIR
jgi:putative membrane protein